MIDYTLKDLEDWDARIREKVEAFGLDCYPQEFEICDHFQMLGYMAYSGMPSHYPHWSYGKAYEKLKTLYDYGVSGLPYEMVINANPCLAYLMRDNTLALQVLTIAHVYGHNDFFKNNFNFQFTRAEETLDLFKVHAKRIRHYMEDPSIGLEKVEGVLDAAHALSLQMNRNPAIQSRTPEEQKAWVLETSAPPPDPFHKLHRPKASTEPDLNKVPLEPEENLLLFIRDHNPFLSDWEKDILTIVHEEACYFLPQIETKIMNEGWASYWHRTIMNSLDLPQDLYLEFLVRHNQVVAPHPGGLNPYHIGLKVWEDIESRYGREKMFEVREVDRDVSFLRRFLTEELMRELDLFQYEPEGEDLVVTHVADEEDWRQVKETLLKNVGMNQTPVIKIVDADYGYNRMLYLKHEHEGRDLHLEYASKTLEYLHRLWGRTVVMETQLDERTAWLSYGERGFSVKEAH